MEDLEFVRRELNDYGDATSRAGDIAEKEYGRS
jgi:hypothetical protein